MCSVGFYVYRNFVTECNIYRPKEKLPKQLISIYPFRLECTALKTKHVSTRHCISALACGFSCYTANVQARSAHVRQASTQILHAVQRTRLVFSDGATCTTEVCFKEAGLGGFDICECHLGLLLSFHKYTGVQNGSQIFTLVQAPCCIRTSRRAYG